jgi:hypothetical protein
MKLFNVFYNDGISMELGHIPLEYDLGVPLVVTLNQNLIDWNYLFEGVKYEIGAITVDYDPSVPGQPLVLTGISHIRIAPF